MIPDKVAWLGGGSGEKALVDMAAVRQQSRLPEKVVQSLSTHASMDIFNTQADKALGNLV